MKTSIVLLKVAGAINLIFLLFHIPFYWMFNWGETLSVLDANNRNILLTFNVTSVCILIYFSFVLLRYTRLILANELGRTFLILFTIFYTIRIVAEFYLWGYQGVQSVVIVTLCIIPAVCSVTPLFSSKA